MVGSLDEELIGEEKGSEDARGKIRPGEVELILIPELWT